MEDSEKVKEFWIWSFMLFLILYAIFIAVYCNIDICNDMRTLFKNEG